MANGPPTPLSNSDAEYWREKPDSELEEIVRSNMIGSKNYVCARDELDRREAKKAQTQQLFWIKLTFWTTVVLGIVGAAATLLS